MGEPKQDIEAVRMSRADSAELASAAKRLGMTKSELLDKGWKAYVKRADQRRQRRAGQKPQTEG